MIVYRGSIFIGKIHHQAAISSRERSDALKDFGMVRGHVAHYNRGRAITVRGVPPTLGVGDLTLRRRNHLAT